ncbi:hypothetical protein KVR01_007618 [Diaporthe batatas]|uniref:uncharacterized protein n=1 Tax=Diaporthe batatas TaxID=748121 RepID=UPI001D044B27|nr:uncharacterized protein KVR01_007618 [Diaporthe batatas]KAG8163140.1 hypothetical protein KVR01_007618 [Diaporthe batatas]
MIEEASLKKTFIVATLVSTLVGTFAASHNLYERLTGGQKKKDEGQDSEIKKLKEQIEQMKSGGKNDQKKPDELERNLTTSGPLIKQEYEVGYDRLGRRFAVGDMITENELQKQIILLQQTVIGVLEDALYSGRQIDRAGVDKLHRIPVDSDDMWDVDFHIRGKLPPAPAPPRAPSPGPPRSSRPPPEKKREEPPAPAAAAGNGDTAVSRGRSRTGKEVVAVTERSGKKLTIRIPARFVVKCHTPLGEYACALCARPRGDSAPVVVLCETPEDLVDHIATEHKTSDIEKDTDIIADS